LGFRFWIRRLETVCGQPLFNPKLEIQNPRWMSPETETLSPDRSGVFIIDKAPGWTSHDVVAALRRLLRIRQVGHFGTLDPFATGVLPLSVGKGTRFAQFYLRSRKAYRGTICFGCATDTYDATGRHYAVCCASVRSVISALWIPLQRVCCLYQLEKAHDLHSSTSSRAKPTGARFALAVPPTPTMPPASRLRRELRRTSTASPWKRCFVTSPDV